MGNYTVTNNSVNGTAAYSLVATTSSGKSSVDFRSMLGELFTKTDDFLSQYASSDNSEIMLDGIGLFDDKSSPAFQMAAAVYLNKIETQLNTVMGYMEFIYKTCPQMLERMV